MAEEKQIFENEGYTVEATEGDACLLSLKILVKPNEAQKSYQKAVKIVNKQISIPGFRKGHAPDRTVISRYASYVEQEWKELLVNEAYKAALDLTDIFPLNKESIQKPRVESCSQEEGASVHLSYEYYPRVPNVVFSDIKIPSIQKDPVDEKQINEILDEIKLTHADWEKIEDRAVEEGDFVDLSIDAIEDPKERSIVKERRFEVATKRLPGWLKKLLIGMHIGESVESMSEVDEEAEVEVQENFKPTKVRIFLHAIYNMTLPTLDDALAKKAGSTSLEDLKNKIQRKLEERAEEAYRHQRIQALEKALLDKYPFALPSSIVASEKKERLNKHLQDLEKDHLSDEEFKKRESKIEQEINFDVDNDLRLYFLNKQIAKQAKISITNEELNDEIVRYLGQNPNYFGDQTDTSATRELVSRMASALLQRKTKEYALSQVEAA